MEFALVQKYFTEYTYIGTDFAIWGRHKKYNVRRGIK